MELHNRGREPRFGGKLRMGMGMGMGEGREEDGDETVGVGRTEGDHASLWSQARIYFARRGAGGAKG